jgi:hypothetical protein
MDRLLTATRACVAVRRIWPAALCTGLTAVFAVPMSAFAQTTADVQHELNQMKQQYDTELRRLRQEYDVRLRRLEARLKAAESKPPAAPRQREQAPVAALDTARPVPVAVASPPPTPSIAAPPASAAESRSIGFTIGTPPREPWEIGPVVPPPPAAANAFNPSIGVVLEGTAGYLSQNPNTYFVQGFPLGDDTSPGTRGVSISESEVNFQASVDPYLFGNLTLSISPENQISVEEAFMQTTALPWGFTLRAGRFFSGIGYMNEQHAHTWDFVDTALPYRVFLNTQYDDDGVQLRWLAPTTQFLEFGTEVFRGVAFPAAGAAHVGFGTNTAFVHAGGDINESISYRTGLSWLHATASDRTTFTATNDTFDIFTGRVDTLIWDAVFKWAPNGNPTETNFKLQGEVFANHNNGQFNSIPDLGWQTGFYAQGIYQFLPRWRFGVRYDQVNGNKQTGALAGSVVDSQGATPRRASAMLEFNTSEFGRFRAQYNADWSRGTLDNQVFLQYIISLGAHGAHLF